MLFSQIKGKLVHQGGLVCTGVNFSTADVIGILVWVAIDKLFAFWRLVNHIIILIKVNWMACFSKQDRDESVIIATLALHSF